MKRQLLAAGSFAKIVLTVGCWQKRSKNITYDVLRMTYEKQEAREKAAISTSHLAPREQRLTKYE